MEADKSDVRVDSKSSVYGVGLAKHLNSSSELSRDMDMLHDDPFFYDRLAMRRDE